MTAKVLADNISAAQAEGAAPTVVMHPGKTTFHFTGTFTQAQIMYRPEDGGAYAPFGAAMTAAGTQTLDTPGGTFIAVVTGTVTGATVLAIPH